MAKDYSNEKWLPIKGYEGLYEVSNHGRVKRLVRPMKGRLSHIKMREKIMKPLKHAGGYRTTIMCREKRFLIHRLVAIAFIQNPNNYPFVNHKNLKKYDNHVSNLEWCTQQQNIIHAVKNSTTWNFRSRKFIASRRLHALNTAMGINVYKNGKFIKYFESVTICAKKLNLKNSSNIYQVINGKYKQYGGYTFEKVPKLRNYHFITTTTTNQQ